MSSLICCKANRLAGCEPDRNVSVTICSSSSRNAFVFMMSETRLRSSISRTSSFTSAGRRSWRTYSGSSGPIRSMYLPPLLGPLTWGSPDILQSCCCSTPWNNNTTHCKHRQTTPTTNDNITANTTVAGSIPFRQF
ncbi:hypothetical protein NP493_79g03049 [Ridgeia piscesae]|uniref:Uncharacterized protein n=1 Tax=Ridgeia piscesae TaxID=27915 RepID=A0AAD9UI78_RIDPI|nr:hypothetical protein NP493_79g03049 [Ridgeia piscesae]